MKYIYKNKPIFQLLNGDGSKYQRFKRRFEEGYPIEQALEFAKEKRKSGQKTKLFYENKPLTEIAKQYKLSYIHIRNMYLEGRLEECIARAKEKPWNK